VNRFCL